MILWIEKWHGCACCSREWDGSDDKLLQCKLFLMACMWCSLAGSQEKVWQGDGEILRHFRKALKPVFQEEGIPASRGETGVLICSCHTTPYLGFPLVCKSQDLGCNSKHVWLIVCIFEIEFKGFCFKLFERFTNASEWEREIQRLETNSSSLAKKLNY